MSRCSAVGVVIRLRVDDLGIVVCFSAETRFFSLKRPDRFWGPPNFLFSGHRANFSPALKQLDVEPTTHLHPTYSVGKNEWSCTSTPSYVFMVYKGIMYLFRLIARSVSAGLSWLVSGSYCLVHVVLTHFYHLILYV